MIVKKEKPRLLVAFQQEKNNSIRRFANFFSAIGNHIDDNVKGVIINFDKEKIQVIYTYEEEKGEKGNYLEYKEEEVPYFVFTYLVTLNDPTYSQYIFEPFEHQNIKLKREDVMSLRMTVEETKSLIEFLSSIMNDYSSLFFKAKTIKENDKIVNVLFFEAEQGIYNNQFFRIKTSKLNYEIKLPNVTDGGWISIKTTMTPFKTIADKWKNKMELRKKIREKYFLIKVDSPEKTIDKMLHIRFVYCNECKFTIRLNIPANYEIDKNYLFDFDNWYEMKMDTFLKVVTDHNINNYCSKFCIKFVLNYIILGFYTNGVTYEEKSTSEFNFYSDYCVRIPAKCTKDLERIEDILEDSDE